MRKSLNCLLMVAAVIGSQAAAQEKKDKLAFTDPDKAGPDFASQAEYEGELATGNKMGVQVIADGDGKFTLSWLAGGLPGAGWDGKTRKEAKGKTEDGKTTAVAATADGKQLHLQINGKAAGTISPEVWASSYWKLADKKFHNNAVSILDSDSGKEMTGRLEFKGVEPLKVGSKVEDCYFFKVTGIPIEIKLWFDKHHRLVRQEFREKGCDTIIQLDAIRRP